MLGSFVALVIEETLRRGYSDASIVEDISET